MMLRGKRYSSAPLAEQMIERRRQEKIWHTIEQILITLAATGVGFEIGVFYAKYLMPW